MSNGVGTTEKFDYTAIAADRKTIETALETALSALRTGAEAIDSGFGEGGSAMTGGSSNVISSKWGEMEEVIVAFKNYLNNTLDNVGVASQANQSLEDQAIALFGGESIH